MLVNLYAIENKLVTDDNIKLVLQNAAKEDAVVELAPGGAVKVDAVVSATFRVDDLLAFGIVAF